MKIHCLAILVIAGSLISCGGGGDSSSNGNALNPNRNNSVTEPPRFEAGVFEDASNFEATCAAPRSGTNPATGRAYPDTQGSVTTENFWLRSWSNDLYLWYDEIPDQDPASFSSTEAYFEVLKTDAITPSGNPRDQFHFTFPTEQWRVLSQSGVSAGYGAEFEILERLPPRQIIIAYVEPDSPAALAGLVRGTEVLRIDGIDAVNDGTQSGVNTINAALFPQTNGESHGFTVRERGASTTRSVTLQSANITATPVLRSDIIPTASGDVGYLLFNSHTATSEQQLITAVEQLQQAAITDLILDLRYNGGGFLTIASQLAYMVAGASATDGRTFETLRFNDKHRVRNPVTNALIGPEPFASQTAGFSTTQEQPLPALDLSRIFVLTTASTCSASESIINGLRGINIEVIQIGTTTCGKPYGFYPQDNCGTTYFTIQFAGENDVGFSDYADGFSPANATANIGEPLPGCEVADDFSEPLGSTAEDLLATALFYRNTGSCPTATASTVSPLPGSQQQATTDLPISKPRGLNNRILGGLK